MEKITKEMVIEFINGIEKTGANYPIFKEIIDTANTCKKGLREQFEETQKNSKAIEKDRLEKAGAEYAKTLKVGDKVTAIYAGSPIEMTIKEIKEKTVSFTDKGKWRYFWQLQIPAEFFATTEE